MCYLNEILLPSCKCHLISIRHTAICQLITSPGTLLDSRGRITNSRLCRRYYILPFSWHVSLDAYTCIRYIGRLKIKNYLLDEKLSIYRMCLWQNGSTGAQYDSSKYTAHHKLNSEQSFVCLCCICYYLWIDCSLPHRCRLITALYLSVPVQLRVNHTHFVNNPALQTLHLPSLPKKDKNTQSWWGIWLQELLWTW